MASIRQQVQEMLHGRYRDEEVEKAVLDDAEKLGNLEKIVDGELTLPGRHDAINWHERVTGVTKATAKETAQAKMIDDLSARLSALEQRQQSPPIPPDLAALQALAANPPDQQSEVR